MTRLKEIRAPTFACSYQSINPDMRRILQSLSRMEMDIDNTATKAE